MPGATWADTKPPGPVHVWLPTGSCPECGSARVRRSSIRGSEAGAHRFRSPYRCENCRHRFWVVSHRTRIAATVAAVVGFAAVVFVASLLILPRYVTTVTSRDRDIEEWSPAEFETAATVLTPKGMAAAALAPTENLSSRLGGEAVTRKGDGR